MSSKFPMQHAGYNTDIVPVLPYEPNTDREVDMFDLMYHIDQINVGRDTSQYGKVTIESYQMPRPTFDFYMKWLAQAWTVDGTTITPEIVVTSMRMFCTTLIVRV